MADSTDTRLRSAYLALERDGIVYRVETITRLTQYPTYLDVGLAGGLSLAVDAACLKKFGISLQDLSIGQVLLVQGHRGNSDAAMSGPRVLKSMRLL